jgi:hypothetical protein
MVHLHLGGSFPLSSLTYTLFWKCPHRHTQKYVPPILEALLNPAVLTPQINQPSIIWTLLISAVSWLIWAASWNGDQWGELVVSRHALLWLDTEAWALGGLMDCSCLCWHSPTLSVATEMQHNSSAPCLGSQSIMVLATGSGMLQNG